MIKAAHATWCVWALLVTLLFYSITALHQWLALNYSSCVFRYVIQEGGTVEWYMDEFPMPAAAFAQAIGWDNATQVCAL